MDLIAGIVVLTGFEGDYYFEWNIYLSFKFVIQAIAKKNLQNTSPTRIVMVEMTLLLVLGARGVSSGPCPCRGQILNNRGCREAQPTVNETPQAMRPRWGRIK